MQSWVSIPQYWKPQYAAQSVARNFIYHHIRPTNSFRLAEQYLTWKNEVQVIERNQISLIVGLSGDAYRCATMTSPLHDKFT